MSEHDALLEARRARGVLEGDERVGLGHDLRGRGAAAGRDLFVGEAAEAAGGAPGEVDPGLEEDGPDLVALEELGEARPVDALVDADARLGEDGGDGADPEG